MNDQAPAPLEPTDSDHTALLPTAPDGPALSPLVQGYWRMDAWERTPAEHLDFLKAHVELGVTTVDHADVYGRYTIEAQFGEVLALEPSLRQKLQIVTKCGIQLLTPQAPERRVKHYDTRARHLRASIEASLGHFRTDWLDLVLLHRPDPLMDADEVAEVMIELRQSGKVRHFGVSNFTPAQLGLLQSRLPFTLATNQVEIGPLNVASLFDGTLDQLQQLRICPMAWSVLGGGRLFDDEDETGRRVRTALEAVAEELGDCRLDQVAFAWVRQLPSRPFPILGSGRIERVRAAVAALDLVLDREQWFAILQAAQGRPVP